MVSISQLIESNGLFRTALPEGQSFIWRLLTLKEYRVFRALRESQTYHEFILHDMVFDHCYLGDAGVLNGMLPAGLFISIGELIMYLSGDCANDTERADIEAARAAYPGSSVHEHMKHVILMAFPSYTLEDIESWTRPELIRRFAIAETLLMKGPTGYEQLDTRKIVSAAQAANKKSHPVDFKGENKEIRGVMGDDTHILDQSPDIIARRANKTRKIEERHARMLDRASRAERGR